MNKKIISFILCLMLLVSITTLAFAGTDVSKIKTDAEMNGGTVTIIVGPYRPINTTPIIHYNGDGTLVVIPPVDNTWTQYYPVEEIIYPAEEKTNDAPEETKSSEDRPSNVLAGEVFDLVNYYRVTNSVENLVYNKDLQDAADIRAKESAESFEHKRPDGTDFATAITIDYTKAGENLLLIDKVIADYEVIVDTWMNSAGHKANILDKEFKSTAIGVYEKDGVLYLSQLFLS